MLENAAIPYWDKNMKLLNFSARNNLSELLKGGETKVNEFKEHSPLLFYPMMNNNLPQYFAMAYERSIVDDFICCTRIGDVKLPVNKNSRHIEIIIANFVHLNSVVCVTVSVKYPFALLNIQQAAATNDTAVQSLFREQVRELSEKAILLPFEKFRKNNNDFLFRIRDTELESYFNFVLVPNIVHKLHTSRILGTTLYFIKFIFLHLFII